MADLTARGAGGESGPTRHLRYRPRLHGNRRRPAVRQANPHDEYGNANQGDILLHDAINNYVYVQYLLVCLLGVENLTVIETPDVVLVIQDDHPQGVNCLVDHHKNHQRSEAIDDRRVFCPRGNYDSIDGRQRFKVKRITINPSQTLSVQMHQRRAEHWVVVSRTAIVRNRENEKMVTENHPILNPISCVRSLENPGKVPLELIEVQTGHYLREDDIVRFENHYRRIEDVCCAA
jgi:mannose-1-phosphate guanylyltransferase/mannose-6-phosphate isomerase